MRHNLTNIAETQLDKVDSFYVVGSTTKEGLIEGKSNVKIDLKKAISEGGDGGNTPQNLVTFPITPTKIVGYIDNTNNDAYQIDYDTWTAELNKDIIAPEDLMDYCKNNSGGEFKQYYFDTIIEYDPNIDRSRRNEDDYQTSPFITGGICHILISYILEDGKEQYDVNHAQFYSYFVKVTIDNKDYLLVCSAGD